MGGWGVCVYHPQFARFGAEPLVLTVQGGERSLLWPPRQRPQVE